ncbi:NnrS family protein [Billgrantia kenyensis]|uniref:NnrS family protein n=1 Tax=Billgrantia kenyensis TaxID=321266 RepID=A0A7V9W0Z9_9GAMM|nr:NnrS family protein [Halomonas kenyensis]MBA2779056.1 NnrS family protein [Halomonas kenyensis]MCG6660483.1 NnrS family protein [Halomonas kenyensis]
MTTTAALRAGQPWPILAYAFRPFFLLAALYAPLALLPWVGLLLHQLTLPLGMSPMLWHGHEMLFGFASAALAGFLLTAIPSWARVEPLVGVRLAGLVGLWLAGRIAFWFAGVLPGWLVAAINLAFSLWVLVWALPALFSPEGRRHLSLGLLAGLFLLAQLGFYLTWLDLLPAQSGGLGMLHLAANLLLVMIAVTASRIVRVISQVAVGESGSPRPLRFTPAREHLAVVTLCLFALADFVARGHPVTGWVALAAAAAQADRLSEWPWGRAMGRLYLLLLTLAYAWLTLGLALVGIAALSDGLPAYAGRHLLFLGAVGGAVLAVFCIAGLRHTGRPLVLSRLIWLALVCLVLGTLLRSAVPLFWPQHYLSGSVLLPTLCWLLTFWIYALSFARMLLSARPDGLPG